VELLQTRTIVAKAPPTNGETVAGRSVLGLHHCWGRAVTARAEVGGDSSSHVAARGLDGRRGYLVEGAVASFLGRDDAVAVNIFEAGGSVAKRG